MQDSPAMQPHRDAQNGADVGIGFSGRETSIEIRVHQFNASHSSCQYLSTSYFSLTIAQKSQKEFADISPV